MIYRRLVLIFVLLVVGFVVGSSAAWPGRAAAASSIAFADANLGWRTTFEGDPAYGGRAILWTTRDGGMSWSRTADYSPGYTAGGGYNGGLLAFATSRIGLWGRINIRPFLRTADGGASWKTMRSATHDLLWDFCYASKSVAWACTGRGSAADGGSILRSGDGGRTWRVKKRVYNRLGQPPAGAFYRISSPTLSRCYVGGSGARLNGLWATRDGGRNWARRRLPAGWLAFDFPTGSVGFNVGTDGAVYRTGNSGRSWTRQASPTQADLLAVAFTDAQHGWAAGESGVIIRTSDGGAHWASSDSITDASLSEVVFADDTHGWAAGWAGDWDYSWQVLLRTTDGGVTWQEL